MSSSNYGNTNMQNKKRKPVRKKVIKYHRPFQLNIGIVVFGFIFVYILVQVFLYFSKEPITIYEVTDNKIAEDNTCKGIALRKESLVLSEKSGYVNYYAKDGERVAKNAVAYTLDETGEIFDTLLNNDSAEKLSLEITNKITGLISSFQKEYSDSSFDEIYNLKYDIDNALYEATNFNMIKNLESTAMLNQGVFQIVKTKESGIISYSTDDMENLTEDKITDETFREKNYVRKQLRTDKQINAGEAVYKMVTSENWSVVLQLTMEQYNRIMQRENTDRIQITFLKDNINTTADIEAYQKNGAYYARLDLENYMIRYINDRFLDIELSFHSANGLKIPNTAIVKKKFFKVPLEYFTTEEDSNTVGLVKEIYDKKQDIWTPIFVSADKYYEDEKSGYIDTLAKSSADYVISDGDWIRNPDNGERYQIGATGTLEGVYNVNKGYAVFRRIVKIYSNKEYTIVEKDTKYGLSVYDHIVLNADKIKEQSIIY